MAMQTITIDIINDKALNLLQDLEELQLIRLHNGSQVSDRQKSFKGTVTKQPLEELEKQLSELRNEWE